MRRGNILLTIFTMVLFILLGSCRKKPVISTIKGEIKDLPDGTLYLYRDRKSIDSISTTGGKFVLRRVWDGADISEFGIYHIDKNKIKRDFSFLTPVKRDHHRTFIDRLMPDSLIVLRNIKEYSLPEGFQTEDNTKLVEVTDLQYGRQTRAFFNLQSDSPVSFHKMKTIVRTHPYSLYLLSQVYGNKASYNADQINELTKLFTDEAKSNKTFQKLIQFNQRRKQEDKIVSFPMQDIHGNQKELLNAKFEKHLVIFWASWCAPCRQEIPMLKEAFAKKDPSVEFVSVSIDQDKLVWKKAVEKEKMPWKQFLIDDTKVLQDLQIKFKLGDAIPYTVFVDNNLKVLSSTTGLSSKDELFRMIEDK